MQLHINIFIFLAYTLSIINLQNAGVSSHYVLNKLFNITCLFCKPIKIGNKSDTHTTTIPPRSTTVRTTTECITSSSTILPNNHTTVTTPPKRTTVRTTAEFTTASSTIRPNNVTDVPEILPKSEDVLSFFSSELTLKNISLEGTRTAFSILYESGLITNSQIPPVVIVNIIKMMASSNDVYGIFYDDMKFNTVLKMITNHPCVLNSVSTKVRIRFVDGLLSSPPGVLNGIPKPAFISILGMISYPNVLTALPLSSTLNLITVLSLSKPVFSCLPDETFIALLQLIVTKTPEQILTFLPPSTLFGFYEGIFDRINNEAFGYGNAILSKLPLIEIISPIMTSRMLSVFPIHMYDKLLNIIGSRPKEFPISNLISLFTVLTKSPVILSSLNPYYLSNILVPVGFSIPTSLHDEMINSIAYYLPSTQDYLR